MSVLYTGAFRFPDGDAAALRVRGVARLFEQAGCQVTFAGWEQATEGGHYSFEGHDCHPQSEFRSQPRSLPARLFGFLARGRRTLKWLSSRQPFDIIVAYNPPALFSLLLMLRCRRHGTRLVLDSTEWYESQHLPGGRFGPAALENWVRMRLVYPLFRNVICISHFLETHYKGRNLVNVPPLQAEAAPQPAGQPEPDRPSVHDGIALIYAGEAGKKDRLVEVIRALPAVCQALQRPAVLHVAGMDQAALERLLQDGGLDVATHRPFVACHGRVSRARVAQLYQRSHFSVLFRENKRYAWAGYPTKAMESWSLGCPIIMNRVGDLGLQAENQRDAILLAEDQLEAQLPAALMQATLGDHHDLMTMHCRDKAHRLFAPRSHIDAFNRFFQRLATQPSP